MPVYSYKCDKCNKVEDIYMEVDERNNAKCSKCGGEVYRVYTTPSIHIKVNFDKNTRYNAKQKRGVK